MNFENRSDDLAAKFSCRAGDLGDTTDAP